MRSNKSSWFANINPNVFISTVAIIAIFLALVVFAPNSFELLTQKMNQWIIHSFSWFYVLSVAVFLIMLIYIALSGMGEIKLGPDHSQPKYGNASWFAMLFTAGMGIGLMFFGVAEPVMHYVTPPAGEPETVLTAQQSLRVTLGLTCLGYLYCGRPIIGLFCISASIAFKNSFGFISTDWQKDLWSNRR